jgi:hypothetical protein
VDSRRIYQLISRGPRDGIVIAMRRMFMVKNDIPGGCCEVRKIPSRINSNAGHQLVSRASRLRILQTRTTANQCSPAQKERLGPPSQFILSMFTAKTYQSGSNYESAAISFPFSNKACPCILVHNHAFLSNLVTVETSFERF